MHTGVVVSRSARSGSLGRPRLAPLVATAAVVAAGVAASCADDEPELPLVCTETTGTAIFEQRIAPLLADDRPSSCNQCHLSGVDLSLFARPTPCETMACLRDLGLVNLERPEQSTLLAWVERASPESPLITEEVIAAEHEGLREWIEHYAACGRAECGDTPCRPAGEAAPFCANAAEPFMSRAAELDPGGCEDLQIEQLFRDTVYASRGRCFPCHFSEELDIGAPRFIDQSLSCEAASLTTLRNIERAGWIDVDDPLRSWVLLKPLALDDGGVEHGGHDKFYASDPETNYVDPGYENYVYFLTRYAECKRGARAAGSAPL